MAIDVEVIFEDGVLKPTSPLHLQEHKRMQVRILDEPPAEDDDPLGEKAAQEFIGFIEDAPPGVPLAEEHDQYMRKYLSK